MLSEIPLFTILILYYEKHSPRTKYFSIKLIHIIFIGTLI